MDPKRDFPPIGPKIREHRVAQGFSLRSLGEATGLTAAFLSQVENDQTSPSIGSLQKIATALQVPMFAFLDSDAQTEEVVRAGARKKLSFSNQSLTYEILTNSVHHKIGAFLIQLKTGSTNYAQTLYSPSEEVMYVLQGEMEIIVGDHHYRLSPGDSVFYEGAQLKSYTALGDEDLLVICAMTPPVL
jgi:transcriptional regulator with XRE-family HTH domain